MGEVGGFINNKIEYLTELRDLNLYEIYIYFFFEKIRSVWPRRVFLLNFIQTQKKKKILLHINLSGVSFYFSSYVTQSPIHENKKKMNNVPQQLVKEKYRKSVSL